MNIPRLLLFASGLLTGTFLPAFSELSAQEIRFDTTVQDLGEWVEGDTLSRMAVFYFDNPGEESLVLSQVMPSCSCTRVLYAPVGPIAPGRSDSLLLAYRSNRGPGEVDESVFVYTGRSTRHPAVTLRLTGRVVEGEDSPWRHLPQAMGVLRIKRKQLDFGPNDRVLRLPCANTGNKPLKLKAVLLPPYASFTTEPAVIEPGAEADIVVRLDRDRLPTNRPVKASLVLEGVSGDIVSRKISLTIQ